MAKRNSKEWPSVDEMMEIGLLLDARRHDEIVEKMNAVLAQRPRSWKAFQYRARAHHQLNNEAAWQADYLRVIELTSARLEKSFDPEALSARANSYLAIGNTVAARVDQLHLLAATTALIEEEPDNWYHWHDRAQLHEELQNLEAAHDDYSAVIALNPNIYGPVMRRAEIRIALGRFAEALRDANRAKALNWWKPYAGFDLVLAECHLRLGDIESARRCLANAPGPLSPENAATRDRQLAECDEIELGRQKS